MGASSRFMTLNGDLTKEQVKNSFYEKQENDRQEYGNNPYNGSFTTFCDIEFKNRSFSNESDAIDYILNEQEKWGPAFVVQFMKDDKKYWLVGGWAAE